MKKVTGRADSSAANQLKIEPDPAASLIYSAFPDSPWIRRFRTLALNWFAANQRNLPWRSSEKNPYFVWISEIMLQQTQVATVVDYFQRFVKQFPTVADLAQARESKVLSLWEGLGYYRRARNMHRAAKQICADHHGEFPLTYDEVIALPGIGRYSAGAILSIAGSQPYPILEGNTYRLHARLLGLRRNPREKDSEQLLWKFAEKVLPSPRSKQDPGDLNQALMEIGSEICKPRTPACNACPLRKLCCAHQLGLQVELPLPSIKPKYEAKHQALIVLEDRQGQMLIRKRRPDEWWSGLWDFLRVDVTQSDPPAIARQLRTEIKNLTGSKINSTFIPKQTIQHGVTRYRITLDCYHLKIDSKLSPANSYELRSKQAISRLPLNVTARDFFNLISSS